MKKIIFCLAIILIANLVFGTVQKIAILDFESKDRQSGNIVKNMMKRDFKPIFKEVKNLELIDAKSVNKNIKKSGIQNLAYISNEQLAELALKMEANILVWGDVTSISNTDFKVLAKIFSANSNDVSTLNFTMKGKSEQRRDAIKNELLPKLTELGGAEIEKIKNIAIQYFNNKEVASAKEAFEQLIQLDANDVDGYFFLGIIAFIENELETAVNYFQKTLEFDAENIDYLDYLSKAYLKLEDYDNAVETMKTMADFSENSKEIWLKIGNIYSEIEYFEEAQESYETAIEEDSEYSEAFYALGVLLFNQDLFEEAIEPLEFATKAFAEVEHLQKKLAKCYHKAGKLDAAILQYKQLIAEQPENVSAYLNLAGAYRVTEQNEKALDILLQLKEIAPLMPKVYFRLADIYIVLKDYAKATEATNKAVELDATLYESYQILALIKQSLGYGKYEKYLDYEEKYKDKSIYYGTKADELVAKRDAVKAEAHNLFIEAENLLVKAVERCQIDTVIKEINSRKKMLKQLKDATKECAF